MLGSAKFLPAIAGRYLHRSGWQDAVTEDGGRLAERPKVRSCRRAKPQVILTQRIVDHRKGRELTEEEMAQRSEAADRVWQSLVEMVKRQRRSWSSKVRRPDRRLPKVQLVESVISYDREYSD